MPSASCCFLPVFGFPEYQYQTKSKCHETFWRFFLDKRDTRSFERGPEDREGGHEPPGRAPGAAHPGASWAHLYSIWPNSTSINSLKSGNQQRSPRNTFSAAASFCSREIPSGGLFRYSAGGGIDHGGALHQPCRPSDDAWVVYHRPSGPLLLARWLLLSFWSSIQCSPRCS